MMQIPQIEMLDPFLFRMTIIQTTDWSLNQTVNFIIFTTNT